MNKMILLVLFVLGACAEQSIKPSTVLFPKEKLETNDMHDVKKKISHLRKSYKAEDILVVFDVDNTVLAMNQGLGSDQWFSWQSKMMRKPKAPTGLITNDFGKLIDIQYKLFEISAMTPPQPMTPKFISDLQSAGHPVIALTSRGHPSVETTLRELKRNGVDFSKTALALPGVKGVWTPYEVGKVGDFGFSPEEEKAFKLTKKARDVRYEEGVYLTAGQHKGVMLRILLQKSNAKAPKAIVFIDDHEKHSKRMQAAYTDKNVHLVTYRYGFEDSKVNFFKKGAGKDTAEIQWGELSTNCKKKWKGTVKSLIRSIFGKESVNSQDLGICKYTL